MNANPYQSPKTPTLQETVANADRVAAMRNVRIALLIMLAPAIYNLVCFSFRSTNEPEFPIHALYRTVNSIGMALAAAAVWFSGLAALELISRVIHSILARSSNVDDWVKPLYWTIRRFPVFAIFGAALWAIWVFAFYQLNMRFYAVSVPIGIAAHLLAAGLYIPLAYQWFRLESSKTGTPTT